MKSKRQAKILEIIATTGVETQEQLLQELQQAGFSCTQATISRDIKDMGNPFSERLNTIFRECVTSFDYAQNIVVIHTLPGLANAAASALDAMKADYILGTLAGDDTVVAILRDTNSAAVFCGEIKALIS